MSNPVSPPHTVGTFNGICSMHGLYSGQQCPTCAGYSVVPAWMVTQPNVLGASFTVTTVPTQAQVDALEARVKYLEDRFDCLKNLERQIREGKTA